MFPKQIYNFDEKTARDESKITYEKLNELDEYTGKIDLVSKKDKQGKDYFVIKRTEKQLKKITEEAQKMKKNEGEQKEKKDEKKEKKESKEITGETLNITILIQKLKTIMKWIEARQQIGSAQNCVFTKKKKHKSACCSKRLYLFLLAQ